jgi:hypothetical protein
MDNCVLCCLLFTYYIYMSFNTQISIGWWLVAQEFIFFCSLFLCTAAFYFFILKNNFIIFDENDYVREFKKRSFWLDILLLAYTLR